MKLSPFLLAALLALSPLQAAETLPDLGESSQSELSPAAERRLGESIMRDLRWRDPAYVDDPEVEAYINELGGRLAAASPEVRQDFLFFVMRDSSLNAFALPGGFVGVHTALILAARTESELAGVLSHEIAHVTQRHIARLVGKQSQASLMSMAAVLVAILAARSNSQVSQAAMAAGAAANIQTQINYTRDFEREADRIGFQILEGAGFDVNGMASFFERLQKSGRVYENNAPGYLRTHPLTTERISDMENRAQSKPYRQVRDSLAFHLVRAKLRAQHGMPREAAADFQAQLASRSFGSEAGTRYGLAQALLRVPDAAGARQQLAALRKLGVVSPMVDQLEADVRLAERDPAGAVKVLRDAKARHPRARALTYALVDALLANGQPREALGIVVPEVQLQPADARLWALQAKAYAAAGQRLQQHRSQAELYALQGSTAAAVEQLQIATKAGDGDFYELSAVEARLKELRARQLEEARQARPGGS